MSRGRGFLRRRIHPRLRDHDLVPACGVLSIHMVRRAIVYYLLPEVF